MYGDDEHVYDLGVDWRWEEQHISRMMCHYCMYNKYNDR